ncbi:MAG: cytochrome c-type biogenesis protein CcmH [Alphaproteobacteria bacterium]|nr:MAG: cytochrome c-type biogenesis protein CcmH [Alphaproteobacteria bacterium]
MRAALFAILLFLPVMAFAVMPDEKLSDPALELRAQEISRQLRCVVCQNETVDESNAPIAADIRKLVRARLTAGDTDQQILDHMTERYGEFVLLKPKWSAQNAALWLAPFLVLMLGLCLLIKRRGKK